MATCDLCGGSCTTTDLSELRTPFRIYGVCDICPECTKWANKQHTALVLEIGPKMRELITERKGNPKPTSWWRRLKLW